MKFYLAGRDSIVIQVKNRAQVQLPKLRSNVVFELRRVGPPLFIRCIRIELSIQNILRCRFRRGGKEDFFLILQTDFNPEICISRWMRFML